MDFLQDFDNLLGAHLHPFFTVDDLPIRSEFDLELQLNDQQGMGTQTAGDFHSRGFHRF